MIKLNYIILHKVKINLVGIAVNESVEQWKDCVARFECSVATNVVQVQGASVARTTCSISRMIGIIEKIPSVWGDNAR